MNPESGSPDLLLRLTVLPLGTDEAQDLEISLSRQIRRNLLQTLHLLSDVDEEWAQMRDSQRVDWPRSFRDDLHRTAPVA